MIVVDTNMIAYFYIQSEYTSLAEQLFVKDQDWIAPFLWRSEFNNVVTFYLRKRNFNLSKAVLLIEGAQHFMQGKEHFVSAATIMNLVNNSNCSAYDCEFVALAKDLSVPLITTDKQILSAFPAIAQSPKHFIGS